jgi:hypothetical protein
MPLISGLPGYVTASSQTFGIQSGLMPSRFRQIVMSGNVADNTLSSANPGPLYPAAGVVVVQSTASLVNQVVSTADAVIGARASFIYIPVSTGPFNGSTGPAFQGCGTALVWNDAIKALMVWSSGSATWMTQVVGTSFAAGNTVFTSS